MIFKTVKVTILLPLLVILIIVLGLLFGYTPDWVLEGHQKSFDHLATQPTFLQRENAGTQGVDIDSYPPSILIKTPLDEAFNNAVLLMQNGHYSQSLTYWHEVIRINPALPEAHVNIGFVMIELGMMQEAMNSFQIALDLRPEQANAYWGLAEVYEKQGMIPEATGAMRAFLHLSENELFNNRARAALWEWEQAAINKDKQKENQVSTPKE